MTKEKILVDGNNRGNLIRENNVRNYTQKNAIYLDQRVSDDPQTKQLLTFPDGVTTITQATVGLKTLYTILNPHENAITHHCVQSSGLWDVMPTAVATRAFSGQVV